MGLFQTHAIPLSLLKQAFLSPLEVYSNLCARGGGERLLQPRREVFVKEFKRVGFCTICTQISFVTVNRTFLYIITRLHIPHDNRDKLLQSFLTHIVSRLDPPRQQNNHFWTFLLFQTTWAATCDGGQFRCSRNKIANFIERTIVETRLDASFGDDISHKEYKRTPRSTIGLISLRNRRHELHKKLFHLVTMVIMH